MDYRILLRSGPFHSSSRRSILLYLTFDLSQGPEERGKEEENVVKGNKQEVEE